jgi:hypothetical protein
MVTCAHNSVVYVITPLRLCEELGRNGRGRLGWGQGLRVDRRRLKNLGSPRPGRKERGHHEDGQRDHEYMTQSRHQLAPNSPTAPSNINTT